MKKLLAVLMLPLMLLVLSGCGDEKAARKVREEEHREKVLIQITNLTNRVDVIWNKIPPAVKGNPGVKQVHERLLSDLEDATRSVPSESLSQVERNLHLMEAYRLVYLEQAVNAQQTQEAWEHRLQVAKARVVKLCPNNQRALYHLRHAAADLEAGRSSGCCMELTALARKEIEFVDKLVENPFGEERLRDTLRLRDRVMELETSQIKLTTYQAAHVQELKTCLELQRQTLKLGHSDFTFMELSVEHEWHVTHASSAEYRTDRESRDTGTGAYVNLFQQILETEAFIAENCPENARAAQLIALARTHFQTWRAELVKDGLGHGCRDKIAQAIEDAHKAIGSNPRKGTR